jgi:hypothetical protein
MPEQESVLRLVKDSDPESFVLVTTDRNVGRIIRTHFFTEGEISKELRRGGMTKAEIEKAPFG